MIKSPYSMGTMVTDRGTLATTLIPGELRVIINIGKIVATRTNTVLDEQITIITQGHIFSRGSMIFEKEKNLHRRFANFKILTIHYIIKI